MNGQYLSSVGFKSTVVGLTMHSSSFKDRHFVRILATGATKTQ